MRTIKEKWIDALKMRLAGRGMTAVNIIKNPEPAEWKEIITSQIYGVRGAIKVNGDFYTLSPLDESDELEFIHDELLSVIPSIEDFSGWEYEAYFLENFMMVVSEAPNFFDFYPAESYGGEVFGILQDMYIKDYAAALKKRNPKLRLKVR